MKIRYVQLESDAFLTDLDFMQFSPAERGVYCSMIFLLNTSGGKYELDANALAKMCNCTKKEFEKIWSKIEKKFQTRKGVIRHKRVTKELKRVKKFRQVCSRAGLRGAKKRWGGHSDPIGEANGDPNGLAIAKESKGKGSKVKESKGKLREEKLSKGNVTKSKEKEINITNSNSRLQSCSSSTSVRASTEEHNSVAATEPERERACPFDRLRAGSERSRRDARDTINSVAATERSEVDGICSGHKGLRDANARETYLHRVGWQPLSAAKWMVLARPTKFDCF